MKEIMIEMTNDELIRVCIIIEALQKLLDERKL